MRFRLRTLMIGLALAPPSIGFAALMARERPLIAVLIVQWSLTFFTSVTDREWAVAYIGLSLAEWLVIFAIAACLLELLMPEIQPARESSF